MDQGTVLRGGDGHRPGQDDLSRRRRRRGRNAAAGTILYKGDFGAQCKYAYDKIKRLLDKHGAKLGDVAKMVSYLTDVRYQPDYGKCRVEAFGDHAVPAHTLLPISQLGWPGMIVEIDVTAIVPK